MLEMNLLRANTNTTFITAVTATATATTTATVTSTVTSTPVIINIEVNNAALLEEL